MRDATSQRTHLESKTRAIKIASCFSHYDNFRHI